MIAGVERADAGEVWLDGVRVAGPGVHVPPEARSVGLMFQDFALFPHLTVAENVGFGLRIDRAERARRVGELLEKVDLAGFDRKHPHQLSGGEQQRVALARALAPRPRVMLMDEPFSGLDNRLRDGIRDRTLELLKEEGTAVLLVTHEPHEAMRMADEIALMRQGRIVQIGAPYNVYNAPVDKAAAAFFSDINVIRGISRGALTATPFGEFLTPGHKDGAEVEIVIRPQHLRIDACDARPEPDARRRHPGARHGPAQPLSGARKPGRFRDGLRRGEADGQRPGGVPAEAGDGPLADDPAGSLLRVRRLALRLDPRLRQQGRDLVKQASRRFRAGVAVPAYMAQPLDQRFQFVRRQHGGRQHQGRAQEVAKAPFPCHRQPGRRQHFHVAPDRAGRDAKRLGQFRRGVQPSVAQGLHDVIESGVAFHSDPGVRWGKIVRLLTKYCQ
jgi:ABC-type Fe3+/spermidine/putrescine transport system ATPase subunit